jgi:hypothetical protein
MAFNCNELRHDSCDGTAWSTRIESFYGDSGMISENVAAGFNCPWMIVNLFLCEAYDQPCALDHSGQDGHRANIMRAASREIGVGYAKANTTYWVQDFGGGTPEGMAPVVAASHAFITSGQTSFFLNYYDTEGGPPGQVQVVVDGSEYSLDLDIGQDDAGSYRVDLAEASVCRKYYFMVKAGDGTCYRYPAESYFYTYGEGGCELDYEG